MLWFYCHPTCVGQRQCKNVFVALPPPLSQSWECSKTGPFSAGWKSWARDAAWQIAEFMTLPWHTNYLHQRYQDSATRSEGGDIPAKFKTMFSSCSCRKKVLIRPLYSVSSRLPEDVRENNQPWIQYWNNGETPVIGASSPNVLPHSCSDVSLSILDLKRWLVVCPEEAPVTQIGLREMSGDCGSSWCSQCCGVGCCQGGLRELSFPAVCLIKGKFIWNSKYAGN